MRRRRPRGGASFGTRAVFVFLWCACLASAAGGDETDSASGTPRSAPTLLVSFDGFRASYLDAQDPSALPELTALWRGGVRAASRAKLRVRTSPARSSARRREVDAGHRESFRGEGGEGFEGAASRKIS